VKTRYGIRHPELTELLVSWGEPRYRARQVAAAMPAGLPRRVALAHVLFKTIGVLLVLPFLPYFETFVAGTADTAMRQIANAHTFFNLGIALLFLPFTTPLARLVTYLIPERPEIETPGQPKYLDPHVLDTPALALGQALDTLPPHIVVYAVQPLRADYSPGLSEPVQAAIPTLCEQILSDLLTPTA